MDQVKIGKFIQCLRKERSLTQRELAEELGISDKTVSKWERGNGLPELDLMLPLCERLDISVNELLSGEKLNEKEYHERAEQTIMDLLKEKAEAKKKIVLSAIVVGITLAGAIPLVVLAGALTMPVWLRVLLIGIAIAIVAAGIAVACVLDREAGVYECRHCGERFVPDMKDYVFGMHTLTTRRLRCPRCGQKSYCRKRLSRE